MTAETPPSELRPLRPLTVNLIPRAADALELAVKLSGDNKTDTVNRAIQMYTWFLHAREQGSEILIRENDEDGTISRLEFL